MDVLLNGKRALVTASTSGIGWRRTVFISSESGICPPGDMVAYLCSPRSVATNGAALRVDGDVVRSLI